MKQAELVEEIDVEIRRILEAGDIVKKVWVQHAILSRHQAIEGTDRDWYLLCGAEHVDRTVNRVLGKYEIGPEQKPDAQLLMPGYERLQKAYLVPRDGDSTIVPIDHMTGEELDIKVAEYRAMGDGCYAHADELKRYRKERERAA